MEIIGPLCKYVLSFWSFFDCLDCKACRAEKVMPLAACYEIKSRCPSQR